MGILIKYRKGEPLVFAYRALYTREDVKWLRENDITEYEKQVKICPIFAAYDFIEVQKNNIGNRKNGGHNGNMFQQEIGLIAQWMIEYLLSGTMTKSQGFDGGCDIKIKGRSCDVKTRISNYPISSEYLHNIYASQTKYSTEYYIFINYIQKSHIYQVCGIMTKEEVLNPKYFHKKGSTSTNNAGHTIVFDADAYCIPQGDLHQVDCFQDIIDFISPKS